MSGVWSAGTGALPARIALCVGSDWGNRGHWWPLAAEFLSIEFVGICEFGDFAGFCWEWGCSKVRVLQCIHGVDALPPVESEKLA